MSLSKTQLLALLLLSTLNSSLSTLFAQGSLTPPGVPAPTMKTLAQVEPRTPISTAPFMITNSGSFYLTGNLTVTSGDAITIATKGVTLDLNGFTITSTAPSAAGFGITINSNLSDITVSHGHIRGAVTNNGSGTYSGAGFEGGIHPQGAGLVNVRVFDISVNGCSGTGIDLGWSNSVTADSCMVRTVGGGGILAATIKNSIATDCAGDGLYCLQAFDSRGESSRTGSGINATTAHNCHGLSASGSGIICWSAHDCYGRSDGNSPGILANDLAIGCRGYSATGFGLSVMFVANSCRVLHGNTNIVYKYNMP